MESTLVLDFTKSDSTNKEEEGEEQEAEEEMKSPERRDWSSLTDLPLRSILLRLDNLEDFFAFRGVCTGWRSIPALSSAYLPSQFPLMLLAGFSNFVFYDIYRECFYNIGSSWGFSGFHIGYSHGFVITITRPPRRHLFLWNHFTDTRICLSKPPKPFARVLLSSNPSSPDCLIILFLRSGSSIQYRHVGDSLWNLSGRNSLQASTIDWSVLEDMIFFTGKIYALTNTEQLVEVDFFPLPKLTPLRAETAAAVRARHRKRWLAECGGELLMVCVSMVRKVFNVYRWDFGRGRWVKVCDLGGRALFMGYRGFAASIEPTRSGIRRNCIYYAGYRKNHWVFCLKDRSMEFVPGVSCGLLGGQTNRPPIWVFRSLC